VGEGVVAVGLAVVACLLIIILLLSSTELPDATRAREATTRRKEDLMI
jgi:hypothetical protein